MKTKNPLSLLLSSLIALAVGPADSARAADGGATASIEGRVLNVTNGTFIENVRVTVELLGFLEAPILGRAADIERAVPGR